MIEFHQVFHKESCWTGVTLEYKNKLWDGIVSRTEKEINSLVEDGWILVPDSCYVKFDEQSTAYVMSSGATLCRYVAKMREFI